MVKFSQQSDFNNDCLKTKTTTKKKLKTVCAIFFQPKNN